MGARVREKGTKSGKPIGRARVDPKIEDAIRASLAKRQGVSKTARECKVGSSTVQRIKGSNGRPIKVLRHRARVRLECRVEYVFPTLECSDNIGRQNAAKYLDQALQWGVLTRRRRGAASSRLAGEGDGFDLSV